MKKILLIDDDEDYRNITKRQLVDAGFEVIVSESGEEGVELIDTEKPDIVVTDTKMPGIDGFETCQKIKEKYEDIKVIVVTGQIDAVDAAKARYCGADDCCVKTFDGKDLVESLTGLQ